MKITGILTAMLLALTMTASAQMGKPSVGLRAGVNFQNLNGKNSNGDNLDNQLKVGFNAGLTADIPVAEDFYVQPGLLYSTKGAKNNNAIGGGDIKYKISYLEIPINFLYKPVLGENRLLMGFGPYLAFGLGAKIETGDQETDLEFGEDLKRFDAGANLLFGYEFTSNLSAQLNAQLGLINIDPGATGPNNEGTLKNTGFGVSLGYKF